MEKYIIIEGYYESVKGEQRSLAIEQGLVFVVTWRIFNYKTLQYGVFDPSVNDIIQIVAVFRYKEDYHYFCSSTIYLDIMQT